MDMIKRLKNGVRLTVGAINYLHHVGAICKHYKSCSECPLSAQGRPANEALCPRVKPNPFKWTDEDFAEMVRTVEKEHRKLEEKK